jgi:hypothetical protein
LSSGAGGGSAGSEKRSITSAFEVGKVHAASVLDALGRWIYAAEVPSSAFDHNSFLAGRLRHLEDRAQLHAGAAPVKVRSGFPSFIRPSKCLQNFKPLYHMGRKAMGVCYN